MKLIDIHALGRMFSYAHLTSTLIILLVHFFNYLYKFKYNRNTFVIEVRVQSMYQ